MTVLLWVGAALLSLFAVLAWPRFVVGVASRIWPDVTWRIETREPRIAITFDDGPDPVFTPKLLDILKSDNIKATFFLVGERARRFPEIVRRIRGEGHEIGNHGDTWARTLGLGLEEFVADLERAEASLGLADGAPKYFRPAGGFLTSAQRRAAAARGYECVLGSAYAFDPYRPPTAFIAWEIGRAFEPGAIIVLHDSGGDRSNTLAAVPLIVQAARDRGLEFSTLTRLRGSAAPARTP